MIIYLNTPQALLWHDNLSEHGWVRRSLWWGQTRFEEVWDRPSMGTCQLGLLDKVTYERLRLWVLWNVNTKFQVLDQFRNLGQKQIVQVLGGRSRDNYYLEDKLCSEKLEIMLLSLSVGFRTCIFSKCLNHFVQFKSRLMLEVLKWFAMDQFYHSDLYVLLLVV